MPYINVRYVYSNGIIASRKIFFDIMWDSLWDILTPLPPITIKERDDLEYFSRPIKFHTMHTLLGYGGRFFQMSIPIFIAKGDFPFPIYKSPQYYIGVRREGSSHPIQMLPCMHIGEYLHLKNICFTPKDYELLASMFLFRKGVYSQDNVGKILKDMESSLFFPDDIKRKEKRGKFSEIYSAEEFPSFHVINGKEKFLYPIKSFHLKISHHEIILKTNEFFMMKNSRWS